MFSDLYTLTSNAYYPFPPPLLILQFVLPASPMSDMISNLFKSKSKPTAANAKEADPSPAVPVKDADYSNEDLHKEFRALTLLIPLVRSVNGYKEAKSVTSDAAKLETPEGVALAAAANLLARDDQTIATAFNYDQKTHLQAGILAVADAPTPAPTPAPILRGLSAVKNSHHKKSQTEDFQISKPGDSHWSEVQKERWYGFNV
jgi:hypothetical protein